MPFFNSLSSLSVTVTVSWTLFCSSSLFTSHDAGRLASWLARSHCGYVAVIVSGAPTKQKCIDVWPMWSSSMNEKLQTATSRPLHMAWLHRVHYKLLLLRFCTKLCLRRQICNSCSSNTLLIIGNQASKQKMKHNSASVDSFFTCWCLLSLAFMKSRYEVHWPLRMC